MMSVTSSFVAQSQGQPSTDGDIAGAEKEKGASCSYLQTIQWTRVGQMTRLMDQIPNTTNTFLRLSLAIHFYWYLTLIQATSRCQFHFTMLNFRIKSRLEFFYLN